MKPDGTNTYTIGYAGSAVIRSFVLTTNESLIYFLVWGSTNFEFFIMRASDGNLNRRVLLTTSINSSSPYSIVLLNPTNTYLYFGIQNTLSKSSIWRWSTSDANIYWVIISGVENPRSLAYLNDNEVFYASIENSGSNRKWIMQRVK